MYGSSAGSTSRDKTGDTAKTVKVLSGGDRAACSAVSSVVWKSLLGNPFGIPEVIVGSLMSLGLLIVGSVIDKRETVFLD